MFVTWCIWLSLIGSFIEWYTYNDNLDCLRLVVKDPFTALDKTGALVSIWPNVFNHVKFSRESCETFDVKNKSACFKAFISRSTTNLTHLTNPALAALLLRIRFLKQVKYLDSLRFDTAFSTKDDFLRLSDLEEDTEDLVELFNFFFRGEQKSGDLKATLLFGVEVWAEVFLFLFPRYDDWDFLDCNSLTAEIVPVEQLWTFWHTKAHASHINKFFSGVIGTSKVLSNISRNDTEVFVELSIDSLKTLFPLLKQIPTINTMYVNVAHRRLCRVKKILAMYLKYHKARLTPTIPVTSIAISPVKMSIAENQQIPIL